MGMLLCKVKLESSSPISFSKAISSVKPSTESHDAFEERTWRERLHLDAQGHVFVPPNAVKNTLTAAAKYLAESVPGKGKKTWTGYFKAGTMCTEPMVLHNGKGNPIKADDVQGERLHLPSGGMTGGGTRVWKIFPTVPQWTGQAEIYLLDQMLIDHPEKIQEYMTIAGRNVGYLRFRPASGGYYGRFTVTGFETEAA